MIVTCLGYSHSCLWSSSITVSPLTIRLPISKFRIAFNHCYIILWYLCCNCSSNKCLLQEQPHRQREMEGKGYSSRAAQQLLRLVLAVFWGNCLQRLADVQYMEKGTAAIPVPTKHSLWVHVEDFNWLTQHFRWRTLQIASRFPQTGQGSSSLVNCIEMSCFSPR